MNQIHIVSVTDDKYAKYLAVMLTSLFINTKTKKRINIYVIDDHISKESKRKLKRITDKYHARIQFLIVNKALFEGCRSGRFGKEVYYRIAIPDLLGKRIEKAIYLDCDLIIKDDIEKLWSVNISNHFLAACYTPAGFSRHKDLRIRPSSYFNAGVMVMNLTKWRLNHISPKVIRFIRMNPSRVKLQDQDGLNAILHNKWLKLHPKWNYYTSWLRPLSGKPSIIHYNGKRKPWSHRTPLKSEYIRYSTVTSW